MKTERMKKISTGRLLMVYDILVYVAVNLLVLGYFMHSAGFDRNAFIAHCAISFVCVFGFRWIFGIYRQIWRYGGVQGYIRLMFSDGCAFLAYMLLEYVLPVQYISFTRVLSIVCLNCLAGLAARMLYRYAYKSGRLRRLVKVVSLGAVEIPEPSQARTIRVAIVGAGRVGVALSEELLSNPSSPYTPFCFVETDPQKANRSIHDLPVYLEDQNLFEHLKEMEVQEVVLAVPQMEPERLREIYEHYSEAGYKVKVYDVPVTEAEGGKRQLRDFDADELLFRKARVVVDDKTRAYYRGKTVLITGGGGSIGSELCRQLAKMEPQSIVILDVYENGAYDVQQELKIASQGKTDIRVAIVSVCNPEGLKRVFDEYRPQVVIHAAAHKHVPLMETDCVEAVQNNVFGTKNVLEAAAAAGVERFMMVSTDKAVNPTNVMGATKRMCEMLVLNHKGPMKCSATRFGNVLGSAGSVIPLFKKQIAAGGPVTVTDRNIIRYFMTIPEASQLVLQAGAMAKSGELFVLDMGKPVKIWDLAENMIRLSGQSNIRIVETGLRPGEKLFEEMLVKTEEMDKTENELIFIERDAPLTPEELDGKLAVLEKAVEQNSDTAAREALRFAVPSFRRPEEQKAAAAQGSASVSA